IRDRNVTGVQTCALPISGGQGDIPPLSWHDLDANLSFSPWADNGRTAAACSMVKSKPISIPKPVSRAGNQLFGFFGAYHDTTLRSEERRVGRGSRIR